MSVFFVVVRVSLLKFLVCVKMCDNYKKMSVCNDVSVYVAQKQ